jgi:putative ABC transport system permease protein
MKSADIIKDAIANTARSKMRTGLTVMAIFVGAFTLTLTNSIGTGISSYIDNQLGSLGNPDVLSVSKPVKNATEAGPVKYEEKQPGTANPNGATDKIQQRAAQMGFSVDVLTKEDITRIEELKNVESVKPTIMVNPDYMEGKNGSKFAFSPNPSASVMDPDIKTGTGFTGQKENEVILPATYVKSLGYSNEEEIIGKTLTIGITDYKSKKQIVQASVVGIQNKSLFGDTVSLNDTLIDNLVEVQRAGVPTTEEKYISAIVHMTPDLDAKSVDELKDDLSSKGYEGKSVEDQIGTVQAVINGLVGVLNAFAIITLIAASFGIMNTLLMSVKERTREIGLMKAMGMSSRKVFSLFSMEAVFIGFLGSALGAGVAILTGTTVSNVLSQSLLKDLEGLTISLFTVPDVAVVVGVVMLIAFLSGTIPAARAAKQNPIDALHYE